MKKYSDILKIEGVNHKGFGEIPKFVMMDKDLSAEAKAIYAYFRSFAGGGTCAFPSRDKILKDLKIGKDSYYRHYNMLTEEGYLSVNQRIIDGAFAGNIYTFIDNPKKFEAIPKNDDDLIAYSRIRFGGLKSAGYGSIPKAVMMDQRMPIKSKAIYAYFCSLVGGGDFAFPRLEKILFDLKISEPTYYKHFNFLLDLGYIKVIQRNKKGMFGINDYFLIENPVKQDTSKSTGKTKVKLESETPSLKNRDMVNKDLETPFLKNTDTVSEELETPFPKNTDTVNENLHHSQKSRSQETRTHNINSLNINNRKKPKINKNICTVSLPLSSSKENFEEKNNGVSERGGTKHLELSFSETEKWVKEICEWDNFSANGFDGEEEQNTYRLFVRALTEMLAGGKYKTTVKGEQISEEECKEKLLEMITLSDGEVSTEKLCRASLNNFIGAARDKKIKYPLSYMKSVIWDVLITGFWNLTESKENLWDRAEMKREQIRNRKTGQKNKNFNSKTAQHNHRFRDTDLEAKLLARSKTML